MGRGRGGKEVPGKRENAMGSAIKSEQSPRARITARQKTGKRKRPLAQIQEKGSRVGALPDMTGGGGPREGTQEQTNPQVENPEEYQAGSIW